ncbi:MAG: hypothetical protein NZM28_05225 [Fimbriimonadales bacterium]|nr:hypothetical protein [Fimbriimonadales bacterium]
MPVLEISTEQIARLVEQLPPEEQRRLLLQLGASARLRMEQHRDQAEQRLRALAAERGLNWDTLTEEQRIELVSEWLDE